jgi:hypothetical protein
MSSRLLTGSVLAVIGLITVKVVMAVFGVVAGVLGFLFFTVLPIVLVGWIILRLARRGSRDKPAYD